MRSDGSTEGKAAVHRSPWRQPALHERRATRDRRHTCAQTFLAAPAGTAPTAIGWRGVRGQHCRTGLGRDARYKAARHFVTATTDLRCQRHFSERHGAGAGAGSRRLAAKGLLERALGPSGRPHCCLSVHIFKAHITLLEHVLLELIISR